MSKQPSFERARAMPSPWTFTMPPVAALLARVLAGCTVIVDPFAGRSTLATHRGDLAQGQEARAYLRSLVASGLVADAVLLDPPYSPRQVAEHYRRAGLDVKRADTTSALYAECKDLLAQLLRPGGVAVTFGWNTNGFGKGRGFSLVEVLAVAHGGGHNDTLCTVERRTTDTNTDDP